MKKLMRSIVTNGALVACLYAAGYSAAYAQQQGVSIISPKVAGSLTKFGLAVVVGSADLILTSGRSTVSSADAALLEEDLTTLVDEYRSKTRAASFAASLMEAGGEVIISTGQTLASASGVGILPAGAVASFARAGNERFAEFVASEGMGKARGVLASGLLTMTTNDRNEFDRRIDQKDFEGAAALFDDRTQKLSRLQSILGDDPEAAAKARELVHSTLQKTSSAALINAGKAFAEAQNVEKKLTDHVRTAKAFGQTVTKRLSALQQASKELNNGIASLSDDLTKLKEDQQATAHQLGLVQDILYDQQPPEVKLALLNAGAKPGLTLFQRKTAAKYLKTEVKKKKVMFFASKVVQATSDVNTIMTNFGIQDKRFSQALQYGSVANAALSQVFNGNYLGAMASISGLFGKGQKDPNQVQFERVFDELAEIRKQLDVVVELQKKTLFAIEQLSEQIASVEKGLHERLNNVEFELKSLSAATHVQLWNSYAPCMTAWDKRNNPEYQFDEQALRFRSVNGLQRYANDWARSAAFPCASALRNLFSQLRIAADFDNPLQLGFAITKLPEAPANKDKRTFARSDLQEYLEKVHEPAANLVLQSWAMQRANNVALGSIAGAFALLSSPASTSKALVQRLDRLSNLPNDSGPFRACAQHSLLNLRAKTLLCSDGARLLPNDTLNDEKAEDRTRQFLREAIVREQVGHLVRWAGLVSGPANLAPGGATDAEPIALKDLAKSTSPTTVSYGRDLIVSALTIADIAIAQQALVYGDLTAYFIVKELWNAEKRKFRDAQTARQKAARTLLENANNPWLQRNVALLLLDKQEKKCGKSICKSTAFGYRIALSPLFKFPEFLSDDADKAGALKPITKQQLSRAKQLLLGLFDLPDDLEVIVVEHAPNGTAVPRQVQLVVNGYKLPLPTQSVWENKKLSYPPAMLERVREREVLAQRWAEYAVFDDLDEVTATRMVRTMAGGTGE